MNPVALLLFGVVLGTLASQGSQTVDQQALQKFQSALDAYADLHRKLARTLPSLATRATPASVYARERALEKLIATARPNARQGDVFVPEIQPLVRRICREILTGPDGPALVNEIRGEEEERRALRARINERYPDDVPLSTVPFRLLSALPRLPEELEYRFLGSDLVLLDVNARMVVDFLRDVLPR